MKFLSRKKILHDFLGIFILLHSLFKGVQEKIIPASTHFLRKYIAKTPKKAYL
jgi:hypothetical protein